MVRRQRDEVYAAAVEERIVIDQECVNLLRPEARKGHINLAIGARGKDFNLPPNRHSCADVRDWPEATACRAVKFAGLSSIL
jgi:hypothetical protein